MILAILILPRAVEFGRDIAVILGLYVLPAGIGELNAEPESTITNFRLLHPASRNSALRGIVAMFVVNNGLNSANAVVDAIGNMLQPLC